MLLPFLRRSFAPERDWVRPNPPSRYKGKPGFNCRLDSGHCFVNSGYTLHDLRRTLKGLIRARIHILLPLSATGSSSWEISAESTRRFLLALYRRFSVVLGPASFCGFFAYFDAWRNLLGTSGFSFWSPSPPPLPPLGTARSVRRCCALGRADLVHAGQCRLHSPLLMWFTLCEWTITWPKPIVPERLKAAESAPDIGGYQRFCRTRRPPLQRFCARSCGESG